MRDNYECQLCGRKLEDDEDIFNVHHIDYDKTNSDEMNLIYLCKPCHMKTNFNRDKWQQQFRKIIKKEKYNFPKIVPKKWGKEIWIWNGFKYCGKKLYLKKGYFSSLHYHKEKDETFHIFKGKLKLETSFFNDSANLVSSLMEEGDTIRIMPKTIHRFTGLQNTVILEISTHHDEGDSFRIEKSGAIPRT